MGVLGDGGEVREAKGRKPSSTLKTSRIDAAATRFNHAAFSVFTRFLLLVLKTSFVYRATSSLLFAYNTSAGSRASLPITFAWS